MKTISLLLLAIAFSSLSAGAQSTSQKFDVSGNCGMCKKTIESAAKTAGASFASWDAATKELHVTYNAKNTAADKIKAAVAGSGYDTPGFAAPAAAYDKLHECCKYERVVPGAACAKPGCCAVASSKECCKGDTCTMPERVVPGAAGAKSGCCAVASGKECCKGDTCTMPGLHSSAAGTKALKTKATQATTCIPPSL